MALSKNNKKLLIFGGLFSSGILAYLLFKNGKKIQFVDNVWCADSQCSNVDPTTYVSFSGKFINASGDNNNTGNVNLLFTEPHNLSAGEEILVKQDAGATYPEYDGWRRISYVYNEYVVMLDIPRKGNTPAEGGFIERGSVFSRIS